MDLRLTDEQRELQQLACRVAGDVAASASLEPLVRAGLTTFGLAEEDGGAGATIADAVVVAEEMGRALAPGFATATALIAPQALGLMASDDERAEVAAAIGAGRPVCMTVAEDLSWPPGRSALAWGWHEDAAVVGPSVGGMRRLAERPTGGRPTADESLLVADVTLPAETQIPTNGSTLRFMGRVNVLLAGLLVGHMAQALDLAVQHAKDREQFGVKIGSFQAIKHMCADMFVAVESSRSAAYGAAAMADEADNAHDVSRAGALAKSWCADSAITTVETAIQVFGGMGFTWECPLHHYLRAAHVVRSSFLGPRAALDVVAGLSRWS